jgi:preprotein translocase subunit SecA
MNDQRKVIYEQRKELMSVEEVADEVAGMRTEVVEEMVARCIPERAYAEQWDVAALHEEVLRIFNIDLPVAEWAKEEGIADQEIRHRVQDAADRKMAEKAANYGPETMRMVEKSLLLQILDQAWKDHLLQLDHLRQGISLRAYGQRDPLNEYKREAFNLFEVMLHDLRERVTSVLAHVELRVDANPEEVLERRPPRSMHETRTDPALGGAVTVEPTFATASTAQRRTTMDPMDSSTWTSTPRNAACPCGSGRKYKHCHGAA